MRVLVIGAGGPAGVNVCRALHAAGHEVVAHDKEADHLVWAKPYLARSGGIAPEVVMVQPDVEVLRWATHEHDYAIFMPSAQTIALCQDKFGCGVIWRRWSLREDEIILVDSYGQLVYAEAEFPDGFWLRARSGAGAKGAIHARRWAEAQHWFGFWRARDPEIEFIAEGFLPGRDYSWCGIWRNGELLVSMARERLEYLYPNLTPEGLTGTPTRAQIVHSADVNEMAEAAVLAVDQEPNGVFCVDLRENEDGEPRPTEINAGRFSTTIGLWSIYQPQTNFVALAAELALGDDSRLDDWEDLPEGLTLSRHIDCGHIFTMAKVPA